MKPPRLTEIGVKVAAVREPGGLWHREFPTYRWEAPKAACDLRVLHPCQAARLTDEQRAREFMCPACFPSIPPGSGRDQ